MWDLIVAVLHGDTKQGKQVPEDLFANQREIRAVRHTLPKRKKFHGVDTERSQYPRGKINVLKNIDCIPSNVQSSHQETLLYVFKNNEAVIKMIINGRSETMRHAQDPQICALFDQIKLDPKIQIKYIDTRNQLADILTKRNFTRDEWNHLLCLFNINHFSFTDCSEVM